MIRKAVILSVFFLAGALMVPSARAGEAWEFGLKVGVSYFSMGGESAGLTDYKAGFCAGGLVARKISRTFTLQAEAQYVMKGGEKRIIEGSYKEKYTLTYLEFPLLAKVVFPPSKDKPETPSYRSVGNEGFTPGFYAGPVIGFNLSATRTYSEFQLTEDISGVKNLDYGLAIGGGFDSALPKGKMLFDLRYTFGLRKILDLDSDADPDILNRGVTIMVGYVF
ncbi:MAG: porin family protein [Candidatus Zixiibacteriota bacterium]